MVSKQVFLLTRATQVKNSFTRKCHYLHHFCSTSTCALGGHQFFDRQHFDIIVPTDSRTSGQTSAHGSKGTPRHNKYLVTEREQLLHNITHEIYHMGNNCTHEDTPSSVCGRCCARLSATNSDFFSVDHRHKDQWIAHGQHRLQQRHDTWHSCTAQADICADTRAHMYSERI